MHATLVRTAAVAAAAFSFSLRAPDDELAFRPAKDAQARKTFSEQTNWRVTELAQLVNGSPVEAPAPEINGVSERALTVLDRYVELGDGRPKLLRRKFEDLEGGLRMNFEVMGTRESVDVALGSALKDTIVEFTCADGAGPCSARFHEDGSGDTRLLEGLVEDLDLRGLLSPDDMGVEDRWEIEGESLARVLAPGGALALVPRSGAFPKSDLLDPFEIATTVLCALSETSADATGEVSATWTRTSEFDGRSMAVIALEWESSAKCELGERALALMNAAGAPTARTNCSVEFDVQSEGEGELLWDLAAGRAHAFKLELESTLACTMQWSEDQARLGYRFKVAAQSKLAASFETP
jgi:hypothetical protein